MPTDNITTRVTITVPLTTVTLDALEQIAASIPDDASRTTLQSDAVVIYTTLLLHSSREGHVASGVFTAWTGHWGMSSGRRSRALEHLSSIGLVELRNDGYGVPTVVSAERRGKAVVLVSDSRFALVTLPTLVAALRAQPGRTATRQAAVLIAILVHWGGTNGAFPSRETLSALAGTSIPRLSDALTILDNAGVVERTARYRPAEVNGHAGVRRTTNAYMPLLVATKGDAKERGLGWATALDYAAIKNGS